MFVNVGHKHPAMLGSRESIREIDARSAVCGPVTVVGDGANVAVNVRVVMLSALAVIGSSRDNVPEVRDDTCTHHKLAFGIVINTPGVTEPVGDHFKTVFGGMVTPNPAVDVCSLTFEDVCRERILVFIKTSLSCRLAHLGRRRISLESVQPSVRSPMKAIQGFMSVLYPPSGQENFNVFF